MGYSGLNNSDYEADNWNKTERVLSYIALKGCAWPLDIKRNCLIQIEDVNRILNELMHRKDIQIVRPFERFTPPEIVLTRLQTLQAEAMNSLTPENWAKKSFFYMTKEGFDKWVSRNRGKHMKAHNIYIDMFSLNLEPENVK